MIRNFQQTTWPTAIAHEARLAAATVAAVVLLSGTLLELAGSFIATFIKERIQVGRLQRHANHAQ
ncbi:MAG: hypothetical protein JO051_16175 [Acidobacteriaceae bacterium]|nr:hypothetical protein [Acidobacteriaceae bacterium]